MADISSQYAAEYIGYESTENLLLLLISGAARVQWIAGVLRNREGFSLQVNLLKIVCEEIASRINEGRRKEAADD